MTTNAGTRWTHLDIKRLREFYEQYPPDHQIPLADIALILGRPVQAIRSKAFELGLSQPKRPKGKATDLHITPCPMCGSNFQPYYRLGGVATRTCTQACAAKLVRLEHPHPRGMLGKTHNETTKRAVGDASRKSWDESPGSRRKEAGERLRAARKSAPISENTHTRGKGGRRVDLDNRYFRSSWEANYARWLNYRRDVIGDLVDWEYEPKVFEYPVKHGTTSYRPDFLLRLPGGANEWHEVKGWLTQRGATALKRFAKYYPDETLVLIDQEPYQAIASFASKVLEHWE